MKKWFTYPYKIASKHLLSKQSPFVAFSHMLIKHCEVSRNRKRDLRCFKKRQDSCSVVIHLHLLVCRDPFHAHWNCYHPNMS